MKLPIQTYLDFIENKEFVQWRLERTHEQNEYWFSFIEENPDLQKEFEKAIEIFENVKINERRFTDTNLLFKKIRKSVLNHRKGMLCIVLFLSIMGKGNSILYYFNFN